MKVLKLWLYFPSIKFCYNYLFTYFTITGYTFWSVARNTTVYFFYSNFADSEEPAVDAFLQKSYFENSFWSEGFSLVSETERKFKTGNTCRTKIFLTWTKFFSVELLLLLPSQGDWHASSGCQYADCPGTKGKKSQQCVCYLNICNFVTISKAEEITGIFYTLFSSIYGLGSLLLHALLNLSSEIILLSNSGQQLLYLPNRNKEKLIWLMWCSSVIFSKRQVFQSSILSKKSRLYWLQQIILMPILKVQAYAN